MAGQRREREVLLCPPHAQFWVLPLQEGTMGRSAEGGSVQRS